MAVSMLAKGQLSDYSILSIRKNECELYHQKWTRQSPEEPLSISVSENNLPAELVREMRQRAAKCGMTTDVCIQDIKVVFTASTAGKKRKQENGHAVAH